MNVLSINKAGIPVVSETSLRISSPEGLIQMRKKLRSMIGTWDDVIGSKKSTVAQVMKAQEQKVAASVIMECSNKHLACKLGGRLWPQ